MAPYGEGTLIRSDSLASSLIGIVLLLRTETAADGYLLHARSVSSSAATRSLLSGSSAGVCVPAASNELPLPAATSSVLVPTTCAILLLPATRNQGPVTALHFLCHSIPSTLLLSSASLIHPTGHAIRQKAGHGSTFSSQPRIEKMVWLGACVLSYLEDRVQVAVSFVRDVLSFQPLGPQMSSVHI